MNQFFDNIRSVIDYIFPFALILIAFYGLVLVRQLAITSKKFDYLIEDITYKSEMLNATIETVVKVSNYVDAFEVVAKRNVKSGLRLLARNKDVFYRLRERLREFSSSE